MTFSALLILPAVRRLASLIRIFFLVVFLVLVLIIPQSLWAWEQAWWLKARFQPSESEIEEIPVSHIDPQWERVASHACVPEHKSKPRSGKALRRAGTIGPQTEKSLCDFAVNLVLKQALNTP